MEVLPSICAKNLLIVVCVCVCWGGGGWVERGFVELSPNLLEWLCCFEFLFFWGLHI